MVVLKKNKIKSNKELKWTLLIVNKRGILITVEREDKPTQKVIPLKESSLKQPLYNLQ